MVNRRDRNGATAAFYAVQGGYLQCLKYLVDKARADVYAVTRKGHSLLHAACLNGHVIIVQWLLGKMERRALLSQTNDAATPVHCAACRFLGILESTGKGWCNIPILVMKNITPILRPLKVICRGIRISAKSRIIVYYLPALIHLISPVHTGIIV